MRVVVRFSIVAAALVIAAVIGIIPLSAQSFSLAVSPATQTLTLGETATFNVQITPENGFNATVFLSVSSSLKKNNTATFSTTAANPPYNNITLQIRPSAEDTGSRTITIIGKNGGVQSNATCTVITQKNSRWGTVSIPTPGRYASKIHQDLSGNICIAMDDDKQTVFIHHFRNRHWETDIIPTEFSFHAMSHNFIYDVNNNLWFTAPSGLAKYDGNFISLFNKSNSGIGANSIDHIALDRLGNIVCSAGDDYNKKDFTISRYDGVNWNSYKPHKPAINSDDILWNPVFTVDLSNRLWIPTIRGGIIRVQDTVEENITTVNSGLANNYINQILCDKSGNIWCLHPYLPYSLSYFNGAEWKKIVSPVSGDNNYSSNVLYVDNDGVAWVGSNRGLHAYSNGSWTTYNTTNSPLPSNSIVDIHQDSNNNIWIVCDDTFEKKIYIFNPNGLVGIPIVLSAEEHTPVATALTAFPNPTSANITLRGITGNEIIITDVLGRNVLTVELPTGTTEQTIETSSLPEGIYLCRAGNTSLPIMVRR